MGLYSAVGEPQNVFGRMSDGTTIIAMKYDGGIMMAADGRSANVSILSHFSLS